MPIVNTTVQPFTFWFENVFPTYNDWKTFTDAIPIPTADPASAAFNTWAYNLLMRRYSHCDIRYTEKEAFKLQLALVYEDLFYQYKAQKEQIDRIYALTADEIREVNENITNTALNPNDQPADPKAPLPFVSAQAVGWSKSGKLQAYVNALLAMPSLRILSFTDSFKPLFMQVIIPQITLYSEEE